MSTEPAYVTKQLSIFKNKIDIFFDRKIICPVDESPYYFNKNAKIFIDNWKYIWIDAYEKLMDMLYSHILKYYCNGITYNSSFDYQCSYYVKYIILNSICNRFEKFIFNKFYNFLADEVNFFNILSRICGKNIDKIKGSIY